MKTAKDQSGLADGPGLVPTGPRTAVLVQSWKDCSPSPVLQKLNQSSPSPSPQSFQKRKKDRTGPDCATLPPPQRYFPRRNERQAEGLPRPLGKGGRPRGGRPRAGRGGRGRRGGNGRERAQAQPGGTSDDLAFLCDWLTGFIGAAAGPSGASRDEDEQSVMIVDNPASAVVPVNAEESARATLDKELDAYLADRPVDDEDDVDVFGDELLSGGLGEID